MREMDDACSESASQRQRMFAVDEQWFARRTITSGGPPRNWALRDNDTLVIIAILLEPLAPEVQFLRKDALKRQKHVRNVRFRHFGRF